MNRATPNAIREATAPELVEILSRDDSPEVARAALIRLSERVAAMEEAAESRRTEWADYYPPLPRPRVPSRL